MKVYFPQSLAGRLIFWLLASLLILQGGFVLLQENERRNDLLDVVEQSAVSRAQTIARLLADVEPNEWSNALRDSVNHDVIMRIDTERHFVEQILPKMMLIRQQIEDNGGQQKIKTRVLLSTSKVEVIQGEQNQKSDHLSFGSPDQPRRTTSFTFVSDNKNTSTLQNLSELSTDEKGFSIQLVDGRWLNTAIQPDAAAISQWQNLLPLLASAVLLVLVVITVVHLETRSLQKLAHAADRLGRGEKLSPLAETGPRETKLALRAFNQMGDRISRFVSDRTQMLAAMSHDLRTPLTSMRLRVEELEDVVLREKLINSIEEMRQMADASLAFAHADAADEPSARHDLTALSKDLVGEFEELGQAVQLKTTEQIYADIRPLAIRRALRNLIENAVRYGGSAEVKLAKSAKQVSIEVRDFGPGIAEQDLSRVFEPFTRLETSRNRQTGGAGLGLAIARSIVRNHGGELILSNAKQGGLLAQIVLQLSA